MNLFENLQILQESNKEPLFSFNWENGSVNDNIVKYLKNNDIQFRYIYSNLEANINGQWVRFDYKVDDEYDVMNEEKTMVQVYIISNQNEVNESYGMEKYSYVGPIYRFNKLYATIKEPIYTVAKSYEDAMKNMCFRLKEKYGFIKGANLTIDKDKIKKNTEIEELTKEFEKEPENIETKIDDPKYNFDDSDRDEEYVVESILSFDDWLDKNFTDLINEFSELHEIPEDEVYDSEDFEEYVNDQYEEYYRNTNRYLDDEDETLEEDFEISDTNQKYTSAKTSINSNKLPAIFKMINLPSNTINLDFGGGRFDNVAEYYSDKGVTNVVYDPYNRSSEHNANVLDIIRKNGGADSVTCSNVLNVIAEPEARLTVIKNIYNLAKSGAPCYFTVYEGSGSGEGSETKSGYQLNKKTADYLEEIQEIFPNAERKGKLIIASK